MKKYPVIKHNDYLFAIDTTSPHSDDLLYERYYMGRLSSRKKVVAHLPLNNSPAKESIPILPSLVNLNNIPKFYILDTNSYSDE